MIGEPSYNMGWYLLLDVHDQLMTKHGRVHFPIEPHVRALATLPATPYICDRTHLGLIPVLLQSISVVYARRFASVRIPVISTTATSLEQSPTRKTTTARNQRT